MCYEKDLQVAVLYTDADRARTVQGGGAVSAKEKEERYQSERGSSSAQ